MGNIPRERHEGVVTTPPAVDWAAERLLQVVPPLLRQLMARARQEMPGTFCDMGDTQFRIIKVLNHGEFTMGDLADRMKVRAPTISRIVDALVARGFVDRQPDPTDRRKIWLRLTAEGRQIAGTTESHFREMVIDFLQPLDGEQLHLIVAAFDALETLLASETIKESKHHLREVP